MKTYILPLIMITMVMLTACSKDEMIPGEPDSRANLQFFAVNNASCGKVINVPSPNGTDDTETLLKAFADAQAAGPGTIVQLAEGTYTIGFVEIHEFFGVFTGAGKGKSVITNKPYLPCEQKWNDDIMPSLLAFIGGNVVMTNMTMHLQDGEACERGPINDVVYGDLCCGVTFADFSGKFMPQNRYIKAYVDNVEFIAGNDGGYGVYGTPGNVALFLYCGSTFFNIPQDIQLSKGDITIKNCFFDNGLTGPDLFGFDETSSAVIENNVMTNASQQIFMATMAGSKVKIKNNIFKNGTYVDILLWEWDFGYYPGIVPSKPAEIDIFGNKFNSPPGVISLFLRDDYPQSGPNVPSQQFNVFNNVFETNAGVAPFPNTFGLSDLALAIQGINLKNANIFNNRFFGSGKYGILIDGDGTSGAFAEKNKLNGNFFHNTNYSNGTIYLGPFSRNCKVLGVANDAVVDDGADNIILGPKTYRSYGPPHHYYMYKPHDGDLPHFR